MLLSRLVRLPSLGASAEALLPFADLLNHDPTCTAFFDWSAAEEAVVLRADRKYRQGEEAHACYGHKTSGELLLRWVCAWAAVMLAVAVVGECACQLLRWELRCSI